MEWCIRVEVKLLILGSGRFGERTVGNINVGSEPAGVEAVRSDGRLRVFRPAAEVNDVENPNPPHSRGKEGDERPGPAA